MKPPILEQLPLGKAIPNGSLYAIAVSILSWEVGLGFRRRMPEMCEKLQMGYPRFMYNARVMQLGKECLKRLDINVDSHAGLPMLTYEDAYQCRDFIYKEKLPKNSLLTKILLVRWYLENTMYTLSLTPSKMMPLLSFIGR